MHKNDISLCDPLTGSQFPCDAFFFATLLFRRRGRNVFFRTVICCLKSSFLCTEDGLTSDHCTCRGVLQCGVLSPVQPCSAWPCGSSPGSSQRISDDVCVWSSEVTRLQVPGWLQRAVSQASDDLQTQDLAISTDNVRC